jgi:2-hydroxy-3-oxopropionate reductase
MVRRLLAAGHAVKVWNRSPEKIEPLRALGAVPARNPVEAATDVDGVLTCLFDASAVEAVVFGADGVANASGLAWLVDHSSIDPAATRALAQRLHEACGADWIDAPVSGGIPGAEAGTLAIMAGGAATYLPRAREAMRAYAGNVTHMGASGAGQATKLCNQTIVATTISAIAEAIGFAARNGIDLHQLAPALAGGWADSRPLQVFAPRMIDVQQQSIGALSTMLKDIDTVMANAQKSGAPMPVTASVQQVLRMAAAMGLAEAELSAIVSVVQPERRAAFLQQVRS